MYKLVSIVLPTYNGEKYIRESIESIINQSYANWELIIVNDCSTDNTLSIVTEYAQKDARIRIINNIDNCKLPKSLNIGFREANGEYFTWTSDDNMYKSNAIEVMVNELNNDHAVDFVASKYDEIDENGRYLGTIDPHNKRNMYRLLRRNIIGACFMYRKSIANKVGEYDESTFCAEDYDYWFRIALAGNIKFLKDNLYLYRFNPYSLSSTKKELVKLKGLEVRQKYVLPLMKKMGYSKKKQIETLIKLYFREKDEINWLKMSMDIDVKLFIKNIVFNLFNLFRIIA